MLDHESLGKTVCQMVERAVGCVTFLGDPQSGAPDGTYCAVRVQGETGDYQAQKQLRYTAEDFTDITKVQKVVQFSLNFYRDGAVRLAGGMREANKRDPVRALLHVNKLGWHSLGPIQNLTALISGSMEERAQVNLYLYAEDIVEDTVLRARGVKFTVSDENATVLAQGEVNGLSG